MLKQQSKENASKVVRLAEVGDALKVDRVGKTFVVYNVDVRYTMRGPVYAYKLHDITHQEGLDAVFMQRSLCDYVDKDYVQMIDEKTTAYRRNEDAANNTIECLSLSEDHVISVTKIFKSELGGYNEYNLVRTQNNIDARGNHTDYLPPHWELEVLRNAEVSPYEITDAKYEVRIESGFRRFAKVNKKV